MQPQSSSHKLDFPIQQHLYQLYPLLPKFANDPEQSPLIRTYDLLLKRYEGIYGHQPLYFIRSPASAAVLGVQPYEVSNAQNSGYKIENTLIGYQEGCISVSLDQNFIIGIGKGTSSNGKIRVNHYQSAVYGEKVFDLDPLKLKYEDKNDEYSTLLITSIKTIAVLYNLHELPALDIIIYDDFVQDQHVHWKEALCLGIFGSFHYIIRKDCVLKAQMCISYLKKVSSLRPDVSVSNLSLVNQFNQLFYHKGQYLPFPQDLDIILAHSMTPMPKMMTQGKRHNLRACQIKIGIQIIKSQFGVSSQINSLKQLESVVGANSVKELREVVEEYLPKGSLSAQKIMQMTQKSMIDILKEIPFANNVIDENLNYKAYDRINFYLKELQLIDQMSKLNPSQSNYSQKLCFIIKLSSQNAKKDLQINSEQLTEMIKLVQNMSECQKILGNGWGGYLLILTTKNKTKSVYDLLVNEFYMSEKNRILLSDDIEQYIKIVGKPGTSLSVLNPESEIWF